MPDPLVAHAAASDDSGVVTTDGIDTTGATLLVAGCGYLPGAGASFTSITDSYGNTWTLLTSQEGLAGYRLAYVKNPTVGTGHTVTFTASVYTAAVAFAAFSDADATAPFDQQNGASSGSSFPSTTIQPGSVTPGSDNELVIAGHSSYTAHDATVDSGFTVADTTFSGSYASSTLAYKKQTSAGAENPTFTTGFESLFHAAAIATFKSAGGSPPPPAAVDQTPIILACLLGA